MIDAMITREQVLRALEAVIDPELRRNVVELKMVRDVVITDDHVSVGIALTTPGCPLKQNITDQVRLAVSALDGVSTVDVDFSFMNEEERSALRNQLRGGRQQRTPGIAVPPECRVVAVTSGKGGVGKSTLAANLAIAMAARGHEVGIIDADVYGYSIPQMMGIRQRPVTVDKMIVPPVNHDVRLMSIGFFLDEDSPVMWRGPMLHRAIEQFLGDVHWGDIDYLFVDMPPGTGDVAISLAQLLPSAEVLVVTTPQLAAQKVAERAAEMAVKMEQTIIGVVENMSGGVFGDGGGAVLASRIGAPLLASVPLDVAVREGGDSGTPATLAPGPVRDSMLALAQSIEDVERPPAPVPEPKDRIKKPLAML